MSPDRRPTLDTGADPAVCRLRTLIIIGTVVAIVGIWLIMVLSGRPIPAWKWMLVAVLIIPAIRTTIVPILFGLSALLLLYILSWPGLGGLTSAAVLSLHVAALVWFLGSTVRPSAWVHRSALRTIVVRFAWVQALAQVGVVLAIATSGLPTNQLVAALGVLALLGLVVAIVVVARWMPAADSDDTGSRRG